MNGVRFLISKSSRQLYDSCLKTSNYVNRIEGRVRPALTGTNRDYSTNRAEFAGSNNVGTRSNGVGIIPPRLSNLQTRIAFPLLGVTHMLNHRFYSSSTNTRGDDVVASSSGGADVTNSGFDLSDLTQKVKEAWHLSVDVASQTGEKAKEALGELTPHVDQLLHTHPYLRDVIIPVSGTIMGTIAAWVVLPRIFRRIHKYYMQGTGSFLPENLVLGPVPYEKSFWGALEDPVRYLLTFMAFSQIAMMVAPSTIASQYIATIWRGAVILSFVWFLQRWKSNVIARALATKPVKGIDRDKLLTMDKISSVGLFVLGGMALAEACGVPVQSILTVGGVGGVATAFAARDVLGNVLSGLSVQMSQPFSIGDTIRAGSVEGQVLEVGLTTTSLLSAEKFPIIVPNSMFSSQVIVNKSRAEWRAMVSKIPLQIDDFDKIPQISEEIKAMMKSNSNVFLEKEQPYCYLSRVERSYAELSLGCNLKHMSKDELFSAEQDILLQSIRIIKQHGATLARTWET